MYKAKELRIKGAKVINFKRVYTVKCNRGKDLFIVSVDKNNQIANISPRFGRILDILHNRPFEIKWVAYRIEDEMERSNYSTQD